MTISGTQGEVLRIPKIIYNTTKEPVQTVVKVSSLLISGNTFQTGSQGKFNGCSLRS